MSAVRTHRKASVLVDQMSDKRARQVFTSFSDGVLKPLREVLDGVSETGDDRADAAEMLRATEGVLEAFDNEKLATDMEEHLVQTIAIGAASAPIAPEQEKPEAAGIME